jgi:methyl-accepting chemotaxis protein
MTVASGAALFLFQDDVSRHDTHLLMIFVGLIALALALQALGFLIAGIFAAKLLHSITGIAKELHQRTGPIIDKSTQVLNDLAPKVQSVTENVEQITFAVRSRTDELGQTVSEVNQTVQEANSRARAQMTRADNILTDALTATEDISHTIQDSIRAPVRQVVGVIAGIKAAIDKLIEKSPFGKD